MKKKIRKMIAVGLLACMTLIAMGNAMQTDAEEANEELSFELGKNCKGSEVGLAKVLDENGEFRSRAAVGSAVTITPGTAHSYGSWSTNEFAVNSETGNYLGFCAQPNRPTPSGVYTVAELNSDVIKFLLIAATDTSSPLYNYMDLFNVSDNNCYAYAHAAIGYAYEGALTGLSPSMSNGVKNMVQIAQDMQSDPLFTSVRDTFKVYVAYNSDQDIVWLEKNPIGYAKLTKVSSNPTLTDGNACYSLAGAQYGVYTDGGCTNQVATLTTDASGNTNTVSLIQGNYFIKETVAPKGYALDPRVYPVTVSSAQTSTLNVSDDPTNDPMAIDISKIDLETGSESTQGAASLEGAQFTVKYYAGFYAKDTLPQNPTNTWVLETKPLTNPVTGEIKYGCRLTDSFKVSGDEFYFIPGSPDPTLPLGTITVEETKAPTGYTLEGAYLQQKGNPDAEKVVGVYLAQITQNGDLANLSGGNEYFMSDRIIRGDFEFTKKDEESKESMANIPFSITSNTTKESHTIMTDENGYYSSASEFVKHSQNTNGGKVGDGLWFGLNGDGNSVPVNDDYSALPYDTYTVEELRCEENKDKALYKGLLTVSRDGFHIDMGTLENPDLTIATTAKNQKTNTHYAQADDDITIIDTVAYTGLKKGKEYTLKATLMNKKTNTAVQDKSGKPVTGETIFKPKTAEGTTEVELTFDGSGLTGESVVVFETLYLGQDKVADHADINNTDQTIHFPNIRTTAIDNKTNVNVSKADKEITIVDTVSYTNLEIGKKYTVVGTLMDKETKEAVLDAAGKKVTAETTFKAEHATGTVNVTFTFDGSHLEGKTIVAFEKLMRDEKVYAVHEDLADEAQTVTIPKIRTTAVDKDNGTHNVLAGEQVQIVDTVTYENVVPNQAYTVHGTLMDKETGKPLQAFDKVEGKETDITATTSFVAREAKGTVEVLFAFDGSKLAGKTAVVFEELQMNHVSVAVHEDLEDESQTIYIPKIQTKAADQITETHYAYASDKVAILDGVSYEGVEKGKEYTLEATLMDQETKEPLLDREGKAVKEKVIFTPKASKGTAKVNLVFDGSDMAGKTVVVFEELYLDKAKVAVHTDISDAEQTIYFPEIKTSAVDAKTKEQVSKAEVEIEIIDTVSYSNLEVGKEYTLVGTLMDQETEKAILDASGEAVTAETTFEALKATGTEQVTFRFDGSHLAGKTVVAFEQLIRDKSVYATHEDITDEGQTVTIPKIGTTAIDKESGTHNAFAGEMVQIVDTVAYENLIPGQEYKISGRLMVQDTGEVLKAKIGTVVKEELPEGAKEYTLEKSSYIFVANGTDIIKAGMYQKMEKGYRLIAAEAEIETTEVEEIPAELVAWEHTYEKSTKVFVLNQTVTELPDVTYEMSTEEKEVVTEVSFVPEKESGTVEVLFIFAGNDLKGKTVVAFENLFMNDKSVATHEDLKDENQSIYFPEIRTKARDARSGSHNVETSNAATVIDTVEYWNLIPNQTYKVTGVLMEKDTGKALEVNGKQVTGEAVFTAAEKNGIVEVQFAFDATNLVGKDLVVFEKLYTEEKEIANHEDINDKEQTIRVIKPEQNPKTGLQTKVWFYTLMGMLILGVGTLLMRLSKKKDLPFNGKI